jgi:filamentous hemagglutinin family protein
VSVSWAEGSWRPSLPEARAGACPCSGPGCRREAAAPAAGHFLLARGGAVCYTGGQMPGLPASGGASLGLSRPVDTLGARGHPMATRRPAYYGRLCSPWFVLSPAVLFLSALWTGGHAQVTLDGSLGPAGALAGPHHVIPHTVGQLRGPNLFHSFGEFNVRTGESATFTGPETVANILGRVTGGHPSLIDGVLRSDIPGANLYLLNPRGVLFGPNVSLDISGSFHVSTLGQYPHSAREPSPVSSRGRYPDCRGQACRPQWADTDRECGLTGRSDFQPSRTGA